MNKVVLSVVAVLAVTAAPAFAADMSVKAKPMAPVAAPSPWDVAFGGVVQSDYNFRGVSQSNRGPSGGAYIEPQFITGVGTFYAGLAAYAIDWPSGPTYGFTAPSAEVDIYGGWRKTWGAFSIDLGAIYYFYPKETFNGFTSDSDFYELYAKGAYAITPSLTVGANVFWTPDLLNYSATFASDNVGATYGSVTGKWVLPWTSGDLGAYVSGELGHWWIDESNWTAVALGNPSYTYWNVGLALTYKAITLDLRYHGTDQSVQSCADFLVVAVGNASNNWCDDTFIAAIKFDTTLSSLK